MKTRRSLGGWLGAGNNSPPAWRDDVTVWVSVSNYCDEQMALNDC